MIAFTAIRRTRRLGAQVLEAILVIPILVLALAAMVQFMSVSVVQQTVESAADEIAREVAKVEVRDDMPATAFVDHAEEIAFEVANEVLQIHTLSVDDATRNKTADDNDNSDVVVLVEDENNYFAGGSIVGGNTGMPIAMGDTALAALFTPLAAAPSANEVRVTVLVGFDPDAASNNQDPVPDVLSYVGLTFQNRYYCITTTARKE